MTLGTSLTPTTVELAVVNELSTWATVITWQLIAATAIGFIASVMTVIYRWQYVATPRKWPLWIVAFVIGTITPTNIAHRFKNPVIARLPYSLWYSVKGYLDNQWILNAHRDAFDRIPSVSNADSMTIIVVIGESLRSDHLSLNGYSRNTTPKLAAENTLVSIPDMWSDGCFTHISVPYIMTRADSTDLERAFEEPSFIPLFKKAGYRTAWFSNQDAVSSYACFMHEADTLQKFDSTRNLYNYEKWLDSDMLPNIGEFIAENNPKKLAVIHTAGSHWWYRSHYPDSLAFYKPEMDSRFISELSTEKIINSYDNTILATDAFIADIADMLRQQCAIIIFISDHGESLGEGGRFIHSTDADELHHPACFVWYSPLFASRYPQKTDALIHNSRLPQRTDVIFHTALDAGDITTPVFLPSMSLFRLKNSDSKTSHTIR